MNKILFKNFKFSRKSFSGRVVKIKHSDLLEIHHRNIQSDLFKEVEKAYGSKGLGIIVIQDVENHFETKLKLLNLSLKLTQLEKSVLNSIERPDIDYSLGWSHGKEKFEGKPDLLKGSFYAILKPYDKLNSSESNVWPDKHLPELKNAFYNLGNQIREVSFPIYDLIDSYVSSKFPSYNLKYKQIIQKSDHNVGRLLHYFPRGNSKIDCDWCGWHNDHGSLTGLCSALYFEGEKIVNDSLQLRKTGLWIQARSGEYVRITYGKNDLAFQLGETLQIQSGGLLHATPHAVFIDEDIPEDVHRSTFALFMEPSFDSKIDIPKEANYEDIKTHDVYTVPKIQDRFKIGMTFGEFNDLTLNSFHKKN